MPKITTTAGQLLVNEVLPEDMRDYNRTLDKKGLSKLLSEVAKRHPDKYREVSHNLANIGRKAAYRTGGFSFGLKHLTRAKSAIKRREQLQAKLNAILDDDSLPDNKRETQVLKLISDLMAVQADEILDESKTEKNPLAYQLAGAGRGNKMNLASLRGSDGLYQDHRNNVIPIPVLRSYSQGLSPLEYWAGTYGARQGVMSVKFATQDAGYLCLHEDTEVRKADGTAVQIKSIAPGELVIGSDMRGNKSVTKVVNVFNNGPKHIWEFTFARADNGKLLHIAATQEHKVLAQLYTAYEQVPLSSACSFFCLILDNGTKANYVSKRYIGIAYTYDIEVDHPDHLFVLANGAIVSNSKQLNQIAHRSVVVSDDAETEPDTLIGLPVDTDDDDSEGALLAAPIGKYKRNTTLTPKILHDLREQGIKRILVRSPTVSGTPDGGVYARDVGVREFGRLPTRFENPGLAAAQALCLDQNTCVRMADGSEKPIRDIVPGDTVLGCSVDGILKPVSVLNTYRNGLRNCYSSKFADRELVSTLSHKLLARVGENETSICVVARPDNGTKLCAVTADGVLVALDEQTYVGSRETFDIEVDHPDHLFVLANGLIVSNSEPISQSQLCLADDTPVRMADGSAKLIRDISPGDTVLGCSVDGITEPTTVARVFDNGLRLCYESQFGDKKLVSTLSHKILARVGENETCICPVAKPEHETSFCAATKDSGFIALTDQKFAGSLPTYDIEVEHPDHLFVLANGLIVSNSAKHTGGVAGQSKGVSGFDRISSLVQIPKTMKDGAAHSTTDGTVQSIEPAPAGGVYVTINGTKHYVGVGFTPSVKKGDRVEAGDVISDGLPNPGLIVQYKGVGEGRRYFTQAFRQAIRDTGMNANRRNVELLARGLINHVRLTDEIGDFAPDDIVQYNTIAASYKPREGHRTLAPSAAVGSYLEKPYLHYTIGTVVKPSMLKDFQEFGVNEVAVHTDPPPFEPEMIRGMANLQHDPDWMTRMFGSGLKTSLLRGVHRGATSDESGTSFVPSRARAVDFGRIGVVRTPEKPKPGKPE